VYVFYFIYALLLSLILEIAYHGTAEANINSILEKGLLVPGKGAGMNYSKFMCFLCSFLGKDIGHATDTGWWGGGIYLSPDHNLSMYEFRVIRNYFIFVFCSLIYVIL
jgi:hypothetical protein